MRRRTTKPNPPSPDVLAAFDRISRTAHQAAAALVGETPVDDLEDASPRVTVMVTDMLYFLCRTDPADMNLLQNDEGGFASFDYVPFRTEEDGAKPGKRRRAIFADAWR